MDNSFLLAELILNPDKEHGYKLLFQDWEHMDYVEDVLCEHFDIDYKFKISDEDKNNFILYFSSETNISKLKSVIGEINRHHVETGNIYETI